MTKNNESPETKDQTRRIKYIALPPQDNDDMIKRNYIDTELYSTAIQAMDAYARHPTVKIYRLEITEV